jgi:(R,R)-butanediol dehydrogenase/meso-butanediol dehydrogenase/diacetyl reductase
MNQPDPPKRMRAAVIDGPAALTVRELATPQPSAGEVLLRIEYCGICGTDLHSVLDGWSPPGSIVGHEWSGRVVAVGDDVTSVAPGDLVVGGAPWCGTCEWCVAGRPALCVADPLRSADELHPGGFAEFRVAAADSLCAVPRALSARTAALAEPLAVALHGLTLADLPSDASGVRALVSGAGPLGLLVIAALIERGVTDMTVSEPSAGRRAQALIVGAAHAVSPSDLPEVPASPTDCREDGFTVSIETSGAAAAIGTALGLLRPTGRLVLLGTNSMSVRVDPLRILLNELVMTGAYCYDATGIVDAVDLLASGRLPIDALLSPDDVGLDDLLDTMHRLHSGDLCTKALVRP